MRLYSTVFAACLTAGALHPVDLLACGYDNPQSIALGSLNWVYPDALYVHTAVSQAEAAGLLPSDGLGAQRGPFAFYRATATMKSFGTNLADARLAEGGVAISVVLIPQAMWTRYEIGPNGVNVHGHAEGPLEDDLVIVTEETVVRALVDGKLDPMTAENKGLLRIYGVPEHIEKVRAALMRTAKHDKAQPIRFSTAVSTSPSDFSDDEQL
ncbi:MAG: hypothetical protein M9924_19150 [Rhizobiaceae bacterium]|nr:hypothetical protein [Rhizobiaceae bacterium]